MANVTLEIREHLLHPFNPCSKHRLAQQAKTQFAENSKYMIF
jgi:hypothetical protein